MSITRINKTSYDTNVPSFWILGEIPSPVSSPVLGIYISQFSNLSQYSIYPEYYKNVNLTANKIWEPVYL